MVLSVCLCICLFVSKHDIFLQRLEGRRVVFLPSPVPCWMSLCRQYQYQSTSDLYISLYLRVGVPPSSSQPTLVRSVPSLLSQPTLFRSVPSLLSQPTLFRSVPTPSLPVPSTFKYRPSPAFRERKSNFSCQTKLL